MRAPERRTGVLASLERSVKGSPDVVGAPLEYSSRTWPDWRSGVTGEGRAGQRRGVIVASLFLFYLYEPLATVFSGGYGTVTRVLVVVAVACYGVSYPLVMWFGPDASHRTRIVLVAWMLVAGGSIAALLGDPNALVLLTYALVTGLMLLPLYWGRLIGLGVIGLQICLELLLSGRVQWDNVTTLALLTLCMSAFLHLLSTIVVLRKAREDVAQLAVAEERARLARDLHDVLGHSLTTITLKTGLARRLLESGVTDGRAVTEVREAEQLSRQALSEIRATVSGYRRASLAAETVGARAALRAAGIEADLPGAVDDVRTDLQEPLAYVLREGVTNVIRHSGAARCTVRLGRTWLEITDDGPGPVSSSPDGCGLAGLADRMVAVGGHVAAGPGADGGFRLLAMVPADDRAPAGVPAESTVESAVRSTVESTVEPTVESAVQQRAAESR